MKEDEITKGGGLQCWKWQRVRDTLPWEGGVWISMNYWLLSSQHLQQSPPIHWKLTLPPKRKNDNPPYAKNISSVIIDTKCTSSKKNIQKQVISQTTNVFWTFQKTRIVNTISFVFITNLILTLILYRTVITTFPINNPCTWQACDPLRSYTATLPSSFSTAPLCCQFDSLAYSHAKFISPFFFPVSTIFSSGHFQLFI